LVAYRLLQRENNQSPAQTSDQNRCPVFMVPNLDRDNVAGLEVLELPLEILGAFIDL
jgi:hypothetical protein